MLVEFDQRHRLFRIELAGRVGPTQVLELLEALLAHPEFKTGIPSVWDGRNADLSALKLEDFFRFRQYQAVHADERGNARVALVAANDLTFGLGRMFEQVTDLPHLEIKVFRDLAAAESWAIASG